MLHKGSHEWVCVGRFLHKGAMGESMTFCIKPMSGARRRAVKDFAENFSKGSQKRLQIA